MPDAVGFFLPYLACCLPIVLGVGGVAAAILIPIFRAPKVEKVIRVARKRMDGEPDIPRDQLRRYLRERFLPEWAHKDPEAGGSGVMGRGVLVEFFLQMRWSLATMVIDGRIDKALDTIRFDEEGGPPRRRRRGRRD